MGILCTVIHSQIQRQVDLSSCSLNRAFPSQFSILPFMYSASSLSLSELSPATLGVSFVLCSVIMYTTIAKMFGFASKNEFEVDDRVRVS